MKMTTTFLLVLFLLQTNGFAQERVVTIPLWENGAPGFEDRKDEPEQAQDWWVKNIHNPSATVYFPDSEIANGTAVIIYPGGGHQALVFNSEGIKAAEYLNSIGVTAIAVKYRLAREEGSPYNLKTHVAQDAHRSVRLVRAHAKEWNIDSSRIGVMGFSAGGETAALVAYDHGEGHTAAGDAIDQLSSQPDFQILIYPGPLFIPEKVDSTAPPTFGLVSNNDECCSEPVIELLQVYREAGVPFEAHIYGHGDHAFNMGDRSDLATISSWPDRLKDWMKDSGLLE
jgi:acetyl esterase/lipase